MEKRLPHITAEMEHQRFSESRAGGFSGSGLRQTVSGKTQGHTPEARRRQEEDRKHREELAQIGPNVIG